MDKTDLDTEQKLLRLTSTLALHFYWGWAAESWWLFQAGWQFYLHCHSAGRTHGRGNLMPANKELRVRHDHSRPSSMQRRNLRHDGKPNVPNDELVQLARHMQRARSVLVRNWVVWRRLLSKSHWTNLGHYYWECRRYQMAILFHDSYCGSVYCPHWERIEIWLILLEGRNSNTWLGQFRWLNKIREIADLVWSNFRFFRWLHFGYLSSSCA